MGLNPVAVVQYTFTHKQHTKRHNETECNTHIAIKIHKHKIRIHKHNNKCTESIELNRNTTISKHTNNTLKQNTTHT